MDFINSNKEYDLVTMGEVMLRLSPPGTDKISQSYTFDKKAGGAERRPTTFTSYIHHTWRNPL